MQSAHAQKEFEQLVQASGKSLPALTPDEATTLMLSFYKHTRADDVNLEADEDMLLFQWGVYDWGQGEYFEYTITRQLIADRAFIDKETHEEWTERMFEQLSLTFRYKLSEALRGLPSGNRWCYRPEELTDFAQYIAESPATLAVRNEIAHRVELDIIYAN
jgi:hypothetical protein